MNRRTHLRRTTRTGAALLLASIGAVAFALLGPAQPAGATTNCAYTPGNDTLTISVSGSNETVTLKKQGVNLVVTSSPNATVDAACSTTALLTIEIVNFIDAGFDVDIILDMSGGPFVTNAGSDPGTQQDVKFTGDLGGSVSDDLFVLGQGANDTVQIGVSQATGVVGIDLLGDSDADVNISGVDTFNIQTGAGDDTIRASGFTGFQPFSGNNLTMNGGADTDNFFGGSGYDLIFGGGGLDTINYDVPFATPITADLTHSFRGDTGQFAQRVTSTGAGIDDLFGMQQLAGTPFNDVINGNQFGVDGISGGDGNDTINGFGGIDLLNGDGGNDTISGGAAGDTINGGAGLDILDGDDGVDIITGGLGNDTFRAGGSRGLANDTLTGDDGDDTVDYSGNIVGVRVSLRSSGDPATVRQAGVDKVVPNSKSVENTNEVNSTGTSESAEDTLATIEHVTGSPATDILVGDGGVNTLLAGDGANDILLGGAGNDILNGGGGLNDQVSYAGDSSAVVLNLAFGSATSTASGTDSLSGIEDATGSEVDDQLTGDSGPNILRGRVGNDTLLGGDGDDGLVGGSGDDTLTGSAGNDGLIGGDETSPVGANGVDTADYSSSAAAVTVNLSGEAPPAGGTIHPLFTGFTPTQSAVGGSGSDSLGGIRNVVGGSGADTIIGDANANTLSGLAGADRLEGRAGADVINGGADNDTIDGGDDGDGFLGGGSGNDLITGGKGNDTLDGGEGEDTISYATALGGGVRANLSTTDISVNAVNIVALRADAQAGGDSGTDTLVSGIENVDGSPFADVLVGDQTANRLSGADGDDILVGRDGNDRLDGGGQVLGDTVDYAQAPGFVTVNLTTNLANGSGSGQDDLTGIENVTGSAAADSLTGDNNANALVGGSGNDLLSGVGGDDNLVGGADDDVLIGGLGNDALIGGTAAVTPSGVDTADFSSAGSGVTVDLSSPPPGGFPVHPAFGGLPPQYASGGAGSDSLSGITNAVGSSSADTLIGNASGNTLTGGAGTDNLVGNAGADTLNGLDGNDTLDGGANDDNLSGGAQRDTLIGGPGDDITAGGDDIDTVDYSGVTGAGVRVNLGAASVTLEIGALAGQRATPDAGASNVGTDTVTTVEEVIGSQFRDVMVGDAGVNSFDGGFGDDLLFGGAGNDSLDGGPGEGDRVTYFGLPSGVTLNLATGTSSGAASGSDNITGVEDVTGSNADDTVDGDSNVNEIAGGSGNDTLRGGDGDDIITAGDGNDNLVGGLGNDVLLGGTAQASPSGVDTVDYSGAASAVTVNLTGPAPGAFPVLAGFTGTPDQYAQGGAGSDALAGINNVTGSPNADVITGSAADNRLLGASGNDMILGMAGVDAIDGGLGDDILAGGLGNDELIGADGVDTVQYNDRAGPFGMGVDLRAGLAAPLVAPLFGADLPGFGTTEDTLAFVEKALGSSFADIFRGDANANTFSGNGAPGGQADTIDYSTAPNAVTVDLSLSTASGPGSGTDTFDGIGNVVGTNLPDTLIGDDSANLILGGDGTDTLVGNGGTDILRGGNSTDTVTYAGSPQPVVVDLSAGAPQAFGAGIGNDTLDSVENVTGSAFSDTLTGNGVGNVLLGLQGNDFLIGLAGNDTLDGGDGTDTVLFTASLFGVKVNLAGTTSGTTPGNSAVGFSTGTDTLLSVEDVLGSQGNDELTGGAGPNRLDGGNGFDTVSYAVSAALPGVSVDLAAGTGGGGGVGTDALDFIENVIGSSGNDSLRGTNGNNSMLGLGGDDTIVGLDGPDSMDGGAGYDTLDYAEATGGVTVDLLTPFPQQTQGAGYDYIVLNSFEKVVGSSFNDTLTGSGTANEIIGGSGDDVIAAGAGADIVSGGPGDDLLKGGPGNDTLTAGPGNDTLIGGSGNDVEDGEAGNDRLIQDFVPNGSDTLRGGDGNDTADYGQRFSGFGVNVVLDGAPGDGSASENDNVGADNSIENVSGGAGNDTLIGNAEVNILNGGGGSDQIDGGLGRDFENGDAGDDTFNQGTAPNGGDVLTGGTGTDTVNYASRTGALAVRFNNIADDGEAGEGDSTPDDIEGATGGSGNDVFQAGGGLSRVVFTGGQGDDSLTGGLGGDLLRGGDGTDTIVGGAGADELFGDGGDDLLFANDSSPDVRIDGGAGTNDFARFDSVDDFPAILIGIEVKDRR